MSGMATARGRGESVAEELLCMAGSLSAFASDVVRRCEDH